MPQAVASHILVDTEAQATDLKSRCVAGEDFADLAKEHSGCPSGKAGGSLGQFSQGQMVPEFDAVIFSDLPIGEVSDPVKTQFGYHLIVVEQRMD
ncbi:peptidylprolyl isomerase [Phycisphaeraceae bacterium D3-23]